MSVYFIPFILLTASWNYCISCYHLSFLHQAINSMRRRILSTVASYILDQCVVHSRSSTNIWMSLWTNAKLLYLLFSKYVLRFLASKCLCFCYALLSIAYLKWYTFCFKHKLPNSKAFDDKEGLFFLISHNKKSRNGVFLRLGNSVTQQCPQKAFFFPPFRLPLSACTLLTSASNFTSSRWQRQLKHHVFTQHLKSRAFQTQEISQKSLLQSSFLCSVIQNCSACPFLNQPISKPATGKGKEFPWLAARFRVHQETRGSPWSPVVVVLNLTKEWVWSREMGSRKTTWSHNKPLRVFTSHKTILVF